ncbi:glycosyltransferase family 2 protein [Vreelandella boliviensis]|uniref:Glycosyltransferase family 2 protein n=1 Tax=Vreelandella boliviensis LC1 TaxID=1072583 RepID=A0ABX4GBQ0_9GAMM|nr:glycosyltransferase family 2 protein [Halomonas boliviensis]OZT73246.1 glycosyltransferase family 2 protein [Halomonas boliviensis LC1]
MDRSRIALVIPAYNEAETIFDVVSAALNYGQPIVVNDSSNDATSEKASSAGAYVVSHAKNMGYDKALNSGFKEALRRGFEVVVTIDADGQHEPGLISQFLDSIDSGADLVLGVRNKRPRFAEHVFAYYTKFRYGINDPLCGMKAYKISVYESLGHFDSYGSIGTELAIYAARRGFCYSQVDFSVKDRIGRSRFGGSFVANFRILRSLFIDIVRVY